MTTEEKARAYDEALKHARFYHGNCPSEPEKKKLEEMFPVLRESEDERIINQLIRLVQNTGEVIPIPDNKDELLAYLEKQKEWKPIFKEGDRVIWDGEEFNILDVHKGAYNVGGYIVPFSRERELHPIGQKPAEWSEEDERYINGLIGLIEDMKVGIRPKLRGVAADRCIAFLKSLRP